MEETNLDGVENMVTENHKTLKDKKHSWGKLRRVDSLNLEAGRLSFSHSHQSNVDWKLTLRLALQSLGVVYGDIGTSPLYVFASTFTDGIKHNEDIFGVLSLIIYTIILIPLIKYVFIVLWANDHGDGGTFAMYSLISKHARVSFIPNDEPGDQELSNYKLERPNSTSKRASKIKHKLENSKNWKIVLFLFTILGTSMLIGDGVLTPCISVLSAVSGIKSLGQEAVVGVSVAILVILFYVQRFGTDKVGYTFAPIVCVWFSFIAGIGLYNLNAYGWGVLRAFNPFYVVRYFSRNGMKAWISLGGVVLCITGTEAMFADLGHFNVRAIQAKLPNKWKISQISFSGIVLPSLLMAYSGQAAYLTKFPKHVNDTFYKSVPDAIYWPTFVVAVSAAIIASQALISGAFSIVSQSLSLGCFPRVKVVHTSAEYEGQVYIPEINYTLMIACVVVVIGFKTTTNIGNAYGIAVVAVMIITTCMLALIMLLIWKTNIFLVVVFFLVFICIEMVYFSSVLYKFVQGGYLPLALAFVLMIVMGVWHYVHKERYMFELNNKVSPETIRELVSKPEINRIPGIGLLYSELVQGIPPIFTNFLANIPSLHEVIVFVSIKSFPVSKIAMEERFLFRQVEPKDFRIFRCITRLGYNDEIGEPHEFEKQLLHHLKEFIRIEHFILETSTIQQDTPGSPEMVIKDNIEVRRSTSSAVFVEESLPQGNIHPRISSASSNNAIKSSNDISSTIISVPIQGVEEEIEFIQKQMDNGVVYLLGEVDVAAAPNSSLFKRVVVNHAYGFLRKNFRQMEKVIKIPTSKLIKVGMTYEL
ncbi:hypothetical protein ACFE04_024226 [Oxalis oulophora]